MPSGADHACCCLPLQVSLHQVQSMEGLYEGMLKQLSELAAQVRDSQADVAHAATENAQLLDAAVGVEVAAAAAAVDA
jgi:hypothetical protein